MLGLLIIFFDNQSIKLEENSTITSFAFNISNYRLTMPILRLFLKFNVQKSPGY